MHGLQCFHWQYDGSDQFGHRSIDSLGHKTHKYVQLSARKRTTGDCSGDRVLNANGSDERDDDHSVGWGNLIRRGRRLIVFDRTFRSRLTLFIFCRSIRKQLCWLSYCCPVALSPNWGWWSFVAFRRPTEVVWWRWICETMSQHPWWHSAELISETNTGHLQIRLAPL